MLYHLLYPLAGEITAFNVFRYITFRSGGAVLTALFICLIFGPRMRLSLIRSGTPRLQILRGLFLTIASACYFIALSFMPIAEAAAVTYSAPLFLVLIAIPMLGERADRASWIAVIAGFVGILFIIQPGAAAFTLAALLPLATGLCNAIYHGLTRKISGIDSTMVSVFIPTVVGTLLTSTIARIAGPSDSSRCSTSPPIDDPNTIAGWPIMASARRTSSP